MPNLPQYDNFLKIYHFFWKFCLFFDKWSFLEIWHLSKFFHFLKIYLFSLVFFFWKLCIFFNKFYFWEIWHFSKFFHFLRIFAIFFENLAFLLEFGLVFIKFWPNFDKLTNLCQIFKFWPNFFQIFKFGP